MPRSYSNSTPVSEMKIGQFTGGINRYSDPSAISDNETVDALNFDLDLNGSLKSRPPWKFLKSSRTAFATPVERNLHTVLGSFTQGNGRCVIYQRYRILAGGTTANALFIYWLDGTNAGITTQITTNRISSIVRYMDLLYLVPETAGQGGTYNLATGTFTSVAGIPNGVDAFIYKERLWILGGVFNTNSSRVYFSDKGAAGTFGANSFFDVRPGDGSMLTAGIVFNDSCVIFKNGSVWIFAFDDDPKLGVLQSLNEVLGVENARSVAIHENVLYFMKLDDVFMMADFQFYKLTLKIPFERNLTTPSSPSGNSWEFYQWLSVVGDRLVCRFYNRIYVYHIKMKAWTRWDSDTDRGVNYLGYIVKLDDTFVRQQFPQYVCGIDALKIEVNAELPGSSNYAFETLLTMEDTYSNNGTERSSANVAAVDIRCRLLTKIYDIGLSQRFKRLMHWGIDVVTGRDATGILFPYSVAYRVTWGQLHPYQWQQLNTWGYPLFVQPNTTQTAPAGGGITRRYIKFPKGLRFRQLQFEVLLYTKGNTTDGPVFLYTITAFIKSAQLVPKAVN